MNSTFIKSQVPAISLAAGMLLAGALLAFYLHQRVKEQVLSQFNESQLQIVRQAAGHIESYLDARSQDVRYLASLTSVQQFDAERMPADVQAMLTHLKTAYVQSLVVLDATGRVVYSTAGDAIGSTNTGSNMDGWAKNPVNKGTVRLVVDKSDRAVAPATGEGPGPPSPHVVLVTPLYREPRAGDVPGAGGTWAGLLLLSVDLARLAEGALAPTPTNSLHPLKMWAMDEDGALLLQSEHPEMVLKSIRVAPASCHQCHGSFDYADRMLTAKQGTLEYRLTGRPSKVAAFAPMTSAGASWIVVVNAPRDEITGFIRTNALETFGLFGVVGTVVGFTLFSMYRTSRREIVIENKAKYQETLRIGEERMRFALEAARVGIWDRNHTTGVLKWSETIEAQYGLRPGTFEGTFEAFVERIHPEDRASVIETIGKAATAGGDFTILNRTIWPDGTVRWLSGAGRVRLGAHGEPVRSVGISLDVTERQTLEAEFQQAQKMEAIGRLAGGVAHDFNNLLTVILGYCELLLADLDQDDPRKADVAEIQAAGGRAAGLTRQLLAFSRKQIIEPTLLDLNEVVAGIRTMLGRLIGEDVTIVLDLSPGLSPMTADRGQVEQIVMNLAVNARDAMPRGGTLTIATANVELDAHYATTHFSVTAGPHVRLTVSDTGTGMTPEAQARLFEPFFTTKGPGEGTGLGLATVHAIVGRSGGHITVSSEAGRGTAFAMYFPRGEAEPTVVAGPPPVARTRTGAETVLVVEDAAELRELTRRVLERLGYTVVVAANGEEALQRFEENASIDLVLTDVVMPGASGPELATQLVERRPPLRVVYMSGHAENAIVHHGVLGRGIAFLHKPFTSEELGRKIREELDR